MKKVLAGSLIAIAVAAAVGVFVATPVFAAVTKYTVHHVQGGSDQYIRVDCAGALDHFYDHGDSVSWPGAYVCFN